MAYADMGIMHGSLDEFDAWCSMQIAKKVQQDKSFDEEKQYEQYFKEAKFVHSDNGLIVYWINPHMYTNIVLKKGK